MKSLHLLAACVLAAAPAAMAGTITFESAPNTFWEPNTQLYGNTGKGNDLGSFYSGVTFGPGAQLTSTSTTFPAHSGNLELTDSNPLNTTLSINFGAAQNSVSFFYNTFFGISIKVIDVSGSTIFTEGTTVNFATQVGTPQLFSLNDPNGIISILITDSVGLESGDFTIDDLTAPGLSGNPVPEVTSTLALFGAASLGLLAFRRKLAVQ